MLNIDDRWLKDWISQQCVPHQRKGKVRGVWFTYDDIRTIGKMLTAGLMSTRQANSRAEAGAAPGLEPSGEPMATPSGAVTADVGGSVSEDQLARFRSLRRA